MNYWLIKSEPSTYSWDDFVSKGRDHWDGVRNYQARNFMKEMKVGDLALFYHSVKEKAIVGIAEVATESYQDPTTEDDRWVAVDFIPVEKLLTQVSLEEIRSQDKLQDMILLKNSRLSVQPVTKDQFNVILEMSKQ